MSEERLMILRMLAQGKITPEEANALLEALGDQPPAGADAKPQAGAGEPAQAGTGEQPQAGAGEQPQAGAGEQPQAGAGEPAQWFAAGLGRWEEGMAQFGSEMARLGEEMARMGPELADAVQRSLRKSLEHLRSQRPHLHRGGIYIDRDQASDTVERRQPMSAGEVLRLENRSGDITVRFTGGPDLVVTARRRVWGNTPEDARERLAGTATEAIRSGSTVVVTTEGPQLSFFGFARIRGTQVDYTLEVPRGVHLDLKTRAGDIRVTGEPAGAWSLDTAMGDVVLAVGPAPSMRLAASTRLGEVTVNAGGTTAHGVREFSETIGGGAAAVTARTRLGDVTIRTE